MDEPEMSIDIDKEQGAVHTACLGLIGETPSCQPRATCPIEGCMGGKKIAFTWFVNVSNLKTGTL